MNHKLLGNSYDCIITNNFKKGKYFMEETLEIYDQYYDKYERNFDYDSYYEYLAERDDRNWED